MAGVYPGVALATWLRVCQRYKKIAKIEPFEGLCAGPIGEDTEKEYDVRINERFVAYLEEQHGADTDMLHAVDAAEDQLCAGLRVRIRWASDPIGSIRDIACFEVI